MSKSNHESIGALGNALLNGVNELIRDQKVPGLEIQKFESVDEMVDFLKDALKGNVPTPEQPKEAPTENEKPCDVTANTQADEKTDEPKAEKKPVHGAFRLIVAKRCAEKSTFNEEALERCLQKLMADTEALKAEYKDMTRNRMFNHIVRDLPDMSQPDHLFSYLEMFSQMERIMNAIQANIRELVVMEDTYDSPLFEKYYPEIMHELDILAGKVGPLFNMVDEKISVELGEDWDPLYEEDDDEDCDDDYCDDCCGECGCFPPFPVEVMMEICEHLCGEHDDGCEDYDGECCCGDECDGCDENCECPNCED